MDDLISRKALLKKLDKWINPCVNCESEFPSGIATAISEVEDAHAVDAAPVVHGEWKKENTRPKTYLWKCSACEQTAYYCAGNTGACGYQFCPNCGAKMQGGNDND